ncbi:MAG: VOC family protein [Bdellovibrionaceae bacterium]|nr:VOC family protein [Pseudobdellovibrionaceae bacterium]
METNELHRGRLIDHIQFVVKDFGASYRFYSAVFKALGIPEGGKQDGFAWWDEFVITSAESEAAQGKLTGRTHLAFQAADKKMVDLFYHTALEVGGRDNGKPGDRQQYHPGYYAGFVLDPDGNNVEAVYHGEAKRSATSIKITF